MAASESQRDSSLSSWVRVPIMVVSISLAIAAAAPCGLLTTLHDWLHLVHEAATVVPTVCATVWPSTSNLVTRAIRFQMLRSG
jgi:hypothetical protein